MTRKQPGLLLPSGASSSLRAIQQDTEIAMAAAGHMGVELDTRIRLHKTGVTPDYNSGQLAKKRFSPPGRSSATSKKHRHIAS